MRSRGWPRAAAGGWAGVLAGGAGVWGNIPMPANTQVNEAQTRIDRMQQSEATQASLAPVAGKGELTI